MPVSVWLQEKDEAQYVERLERALKEHGLYYSYSADITTRSPGMIALLTGSADASLQKMTIGRR